MPNRKKLLFVDDEVRILTGLKRSLRHQRKHWDMDFLSSGTDVLKLMENKSYDIIISDMKMPGMDGVMLLQEVKKRYPQTIRMIFSGQSDKDQIIRCIGLIHQFIAKPTQPEKLYSILQRAFQLRQVLTDGRLKRLLQDINTLTVFTHFVSADSWESWKMSIRLLSDWQISLNRILV